MSFNTPSEPDRLLDERAAAQMFSCSVALLRKMRLHGNGPEYCRVGRLVRYPVSNLEAFIRTNVVSSNKEEMN